jgi:uncharacterized SAM-binding protein YcdF (DUF218 family)
LLLLGAGASAALDARTLRTGVLALAGVGALGLYGLAMLLDDVAALPQREATYVLVGSAALILLAVVVLAGALIGNAAVMARREGSSPKNLLTAPVGVGMLAYLALGVYSLTRNDWRLFSWLFVLAAPLGYLAFGFCAYVAYSAVYQRLARAFARPTGAVVVLGSGLVKGKVSPLLASRLDLGQKLYQRAARSGKRPWLVVSGGRGDDEPVSEAEAMAAYLVGHGVQGGRIIVEDRSRNTEQNLQFTKELLASRQIDGAVTVVTNNFHAFRAATMMRKAGLRGQAVGSPTAGYYWPNATIREYVALLRDHLVLNAVCLAVLCVPMAFLAYAQLGQG